MPVPLGFLARGFRRLDHLRRLGRFQCDVEHLIDVVDEIELQGVSHFGGNVGEVLFISLRDDRSRPTAASRSSGQDTRTFAGMHLARQRPRTRGHCVPEALARASCHHRTTQPGRLAQRSGAIGYRSHSSRLAQTIVTADARES